MFGKKKTKSNNQIDDDDVPAKIAMNGPDLEIKRKIGRNDFQIVSSKDGTPFIRLNPVIQEQMGFTNDGLQRVLNEFLDKVFKVN